MAPYDGFEKDYAAPATEAPEVVRVLREAANIIRERGWCQGALENERGAVCALGAVGVAETGQAVHSRNTGAYEALREALGSAVALWNNAPERTAEEVIQALEGAAEAYLLTPQGR